MIIKYLWKVAQPFNNFQRYTYELQVSCEILSTFSLGITNNDSETVGIL